MSDNNENRIEDIWPTVRTVRDKHGFCGCHEKSAQQHNERTEHHVFSAHTDGQI